MLEHAEQLARMAHQETHLGRVEDKVVKNRTVATKAPGPEDLETEAVTGDQGMMATEFAPFGVVAAITPVTNPTSTIINNTHQHRRRPAMPSCSTRTRRRASAPPRRSGSSTGRSSARVGPPDLVDRRRPAHHRERPRAHEPPRHPRPPRDRRARPSCARRSRPTSGRSPPGPATRRPSSTRPPTWSAPGATSSRGASFDNNIVCTDEKVVLVVDSVADRLIRAMTQNGAYLLKEHELRRLERVIFRELRRSGEAGGHQPGLDRPGRRRRSSPRSACRWSRRRASSWPTCRETTASHGPSR